MADENGLDKIQKETSLDKNQGQLEEEKNISSEDSSEKIPHDPISKEAVVNIQSDKKSFEPTKNKSEESENIDEKSDTEKYPRIKNAEVSEKVQKHWQKKDELESKSKKEKKIVGDLLNEKRHPHIRPLTDDELIKNESTFVKPPSFPSIETILSQRILIIHGDEDSGKYSAATFLAFQYRKQGVVEKVYRVTDYIGVNLQSLVNDYPKSALIMRDALSSEESFLFRSIKGIDGHKIGTSAEKNALQEILNDRFNEEEIQDLCFSLDIDFENLGGKSKGSKARELVTYLLRHERIIDLIKIVRVKRPEINWGDYFSVIENLPKNLTEIGSYIIITLQENKSNVNLRKPTSQLLALFAQKNIPIHYYQSPDPYQIFEKHLTIRLGEERCQQWVNEHKETLESEMHKWKQPRQVVQAVEKALLSEDEFNSHVKNISNSITIEEEIRDFFQSLDDEGKLLAVNLSLLEPWPESDFWYMHQKISPVIIREKTEVVSKKKKKKKNQQETQNIFGVPKSELLEKIRAHSVSLPAKLAGQEYFLQHIEFYQEEYAHYIREYVKKNHPDFLEKLISHLSELAYNSADNRSVRIATTEGIGLISRVKWFYVEDLINEWARSDSQHVRAMVGHVLSKAYTDVETRIYTNKILEKWEKSKIPELQWTAASTYKEFRWIDLDLALDGLERMAYCLDLSPLKFIIPFRSNLLDYSNEIQFEDYIFQQAGVSWRRMSTDESLSLIENYLQKVEKEESEWANIEPVYSAIEFALIVIGLDYPKDVINMLCDWVNEEDNKKSTIQLTGSLIWLSFASAITNMSDEEKTNNPILALIKQDDDSLDALAELLSGSLIHLFTIQLTDYRQSFEICLLLEKWAQSINDIEVFQELIRRMLGYLSTNVRVFEYMGQMIRSRWRSKKMPIRIREVASSIKFP